MDRSEILSNRSSFEARYVPDFSELAMLVEHYRGVGLKVALVSGSFDMIHRGHMRYLEKAKAHGDILIVGVESDEKIRDRKKRPVAVGEEERLEVLCHNRNVDIVTLKQLSDERRLLIKTVRPDVLVVVALEERGPNNELVPESYSPEDMEALKEWCGEIVIVERQAPVSTTGRIRLMMIEGAGELKERVSSAIDAVFRSYVDGDHGDSE